MKMSGSAPVWQLFHLKETSHSFVSNKVQTFKESTLVACRMRFSGKKQKLFIVVYTIYAKVHWLFFCVTDLQNIQQSPG